MNVGANRQLSGEHGGRYIDSTTGAVVGNFYKLHAVAASTISITSSNLDSASSVSLAQGQELNGRITQLSVSSGGIIAYNSSSSVISSYTTTNNKAGFSYTDYLDWSAFGTGDPTTLVYPGATGASNLGNAVTLIEASRYNNPNDKSLLRSKQGVSVFLNFLTNDELIYANSNGYSINFKFRNLIQSAGFQICTQNLGTFTAAFDAYDSCDSLVGTCSGTGVSNRDSDGSALFLGLMSSTKCIKRISAYIVTLPPGPSETAKAKFFINRILLK